MRCKGPPCWFLVLRSCVHSDKGICPKFFFGHGQTGVCPFVFGVLYLFWLMCLGLGSPCDFSWDPLLRVVPVCLIGIVVLRCRQVCLLTVSELKYCCICDFMRVFAKMSGGCVNAAVLGIIFGSIVWGDVIGIGSPGFMGTMCHNVVGSVSTQFMGIIYHEYMGSGSHFDMGIIGYDDKQKKSNVRITLLFFCLFDLW